jgi:predicted transcriptional regulator
MEMVPLSAGPLLLVPEPQAEKTIEMTAREKFLIVLDILKFIADQTIEYKFHIVYRLDEQFTKLS